MAKKLYLNFLWHMHQPYYKDDMSGHYAMPWVYLHGIKDYYDMLWYLSTHPRLKATFNLVPSLLVQLKDYETPSVDDLFIRTITKEVDTLSREELIYLMEFLFFAQKETMIEPIPRYAQLYRKVESTKNSAEQIEVLSHDELLDLEVCFLLAWCGEYLRENSPLVQSLLPKRHFIHKEKLALLEELAGFIARIVPFYKMLQERGQIEISITPFYHPIIPLLMDPQNAKLADENVLMPNNPLSFRDDANEHITRAIAYYEDIFNQKPTGVWPSEGAVDEESLGRYISHKIEWVGTDEEILLKSIPLAKRAMMYGRYRFKNDAGEIVPVFRDRSLSDAIGFDYSRMNPKDAAADFISRLLLIYESVEGACQVNVILDGENAWEFYRNNARDFFESLYHALEQTDWITTQTMSEASANQEIDETVIKTIHPGSWINGNFALWIGQEEKNRAWELLYQAKRDFERFRETLTANVTESIHNELMIAQGSDWFWWFGDTHYTVLRGEFDKLFRKHLKNVYILMGMEIPAPLIIPIIKYECEGIHIIPKNSISVGIEENRSSFFEWMGAGEFNLEKMGSVMDSSTPYVKKLLYGNDTKAFNIALIGNFFELSATTHIQIRLDGELYCDIPFENSVSDTVTMRCGEGFVEISIPLSKSISHRFNLKILLRKGDELLQSIPFHSGLTIDLSNTHPGHWFI